MDYIFPNNLFWTSVWLNKLCLAFIMLSQKPNDWTISQVQDYDRVTYGWDLEGDAEHTCGTITIEWLSQWQSSPNWSFEIGVSNLRKIGRDISTQLLNFKSWQSVRNSPLCMGNSNNQNSILVWIATHKVCAKHTLTLDDHWSNL